MSESIENQVHLKGLSGTFKGREYVVNKDEFVIGRLPECDMVILEDTISSKHAKIISGDEHFEIRDLHSTNGTFVNGERIEQKILRTDDKITFDIFEFLFINPFDVPRTKLVDSHQADIPEKTMIRSPLRETPVVEQTMRIPPQDQTMKLPDLEKTDQLPQQDQAVQIQPDTDRTIPLRTDELTEPIKEKESKEPKRPAASGKRGNIFAGLFLGILFALLIGYAGSFTGSWSTVDFSTANIQQLLLNAVSSYPFYHVPTVWMNIQFTFPTIIALAGILLGLLIGGWISRRISRKSRVTCSFLFAVFHMVAALIVQFAAAKFQFTVMKDMYVIGITFREPLINFFFTMGSIFVVGFILSFIGSLFSRK